MSERVYRLGRGTWHLKRKGFGEGQAAGSPKFQMNDIGAAIRDEVAICVHGCSPTAYGV